jgi:PIN domain nuclease of toxin-antitoxin system
MHALLKTNTQIWQQQQQQQASEQATVLLEEGAVEIVASHLQTFFFVFWKGKGKRTYLDTGLSVSICIAF